MQHRLGSPPNLVVVKRILGKTAGIDNSVLRTDIRPPVWRRLPAIIEACPYKDAREPSLRIAESPPPLGRCSSRCRVRIVRTNKTLLRIGDVNPASAHGAHCLCANYRLLWMRFVISRCLRILV